MSLVEVPVPPRLGALYRRAVFGSVRRVVRPVEVTAPVPAVELVQAGVAVDIAHLAAYDRVCGYRLTDALPPTYPHVLAFPLALALMTRPDFPLPLVGLVHLANRIEVLGPLSTADRPTLRVRALDLGQHPRGRQVDLVTEVTVDGALAWREHSTYLRPIGRGSSGHASAAAPAGATPAGPAAAGAAGGAVWRVPADIGVRYAKVSGDRNPIHTSRLAARLFGFPRRIAHGMWTAARCLASLEGRLPERVTAEMRFQRPVPLPGRVAFAATPAGAGWAVTVTEPHGGGRPHLTGTIRAHTS
jgi:acyl dehydratase